MRTGEHVMNRKMERMEIDAAVIDEVDVLVVGGGPGGIGAAGTAAALAEVNIAELQRCLVADGAILSAG